VTGFTVRPFEDCDLDAVARLCEALWPDGTYEEHRSEISSMMETPVGPYPSAIYVAVSPAGAIGFSLVGMRSHADSCDPHHPVGYLEGWFVEEQWRNKGVGRALVNAAEDWARAQGCTEMASDTWLDSEGSQRAHVALGYEVVERAVLFRKGL